MVSLYPKLEVIPGGRFKIWWSRAAYLENTAPTVRWAINDRLDTLRAEISARQSERAGLIQILRALPSNTLNGSR